MDGVQTSAVEEEEDAAPDPQPVAMPLTSADLPISEDEDASFKYTAEANRWGREVGLNLPFCLTVFGQFWGKENFKGRGKFGFVNF